MASLPIGRSLEPFDPQTEDFEAYTERLEHYLLVNDVSDKKKPVSFFLTVVGSSTYQVLRDLLALNTPASRTLEERSLRECPDDGDEKHVTPTAGGESEETEENHVTPTNTGDEPEGHEETKENQVAPNIEGHEETKGRS